MVFYFFALISEGGFIFSPCYSLELCIQTLIAFLFSLAFPGGKTRGAVAVQAQEGLEELSHDEGQEGRW